MTQLISSYEFFKGNPPRENERAIPDHLERLAYQHRADPASVGILKEGNAMLRSHAADTFDDRVSEDIYDVDDEHAEVAIIESRFSRSSSFV